MYLLWTALSKEQRSFSAYIILTGKKVLAACAHLHWSTRLANQHNIWRKSKETEANKKESIILLKEKKEDQSAHDY